MESIVFPSSDAIKTMVYGYFECVHKYLIAIFLQLLTAYCRISNSCFSVMKVKQLQQEAQGVYFNVVLNIKSRVFLQKMIPFS